jgi:hypothetical protein
VETDGGSSMGAYGKLIFHGFYFFRNTTCHSNDISFHLPHKNISPSNIFPFRPFSSPTTPNFSFLYQLLSSPKSK